MNENVYELLMESLMTQDSGAVDVPELNDVLKMFFALEDADVACHCPRGDDTTFTASEIAVRMGKDEDDITCILDAMVKKGTCHTDFFAVTAKWMPPYIAA